MPGRQPPHHYGGKRYPAISPIPAIDIALFGTYPGYLASLQGGLKTTLGLSQFEVYGKNACFVEGDGDGNESVEVGSIGSTVNLNVAALREAPVELWGKDS